MLADGISTVDSRLSLCRYSSYGLDPDPYRGIAHSFIGMNQWVEYKSFYLTCCSEACGDCRFTIQKMRAIVGKWLKIRVFASFIHQWEGG